MERGEAVREGAAVVEWGGGGGGAGGCFDSPSTPQPHNRLLSQRSREGRMHRQESERVRRGGWRYRISGDHNTSHSD